MPFICDGQVDSKKSQLGKSSGFNKLDSSIKIERLLNRGVNIFNDLLKTNLTSLKYNGPIFILPDSGIVFNVNEILRLINDPRYFESVNDVINLIICHEASHQQQFNYYGLNNMKVSCQNLKRTYECQADILAGYYLAKYYMKNVGYEIEYNIYAGLDILFKAKINQMSLTTDYPSGKQRKQAVSIGIKLAKATLIQDSEPLLEDLMKKTLLYANKILNNCALGSLNIALVKENIKLARSGKSPVVTYQLTYKNEGVDSILMDFDIMYGNNSDLKEFPEYYSHFQRHQIKLKPGETADINGAFEVENEDLNDGYLIYPPNEFQIGIFDGGNCRCDDSNNKIYYFGVEKEFSINSLYQISVSRILHAITNNPQQVMIGPFTKDKTEKIYTYNTSVNFPHSFNSKILVNKNTNTTVYQATFYDGPEDAISNRIFFETKEKLSTTIKELGLDFSIEEVQDAVKIRIPYYQSLVVLYSQSKGSDVIIGISILKYQ